MATSPAQEKPRQRETRHGPGQIAEPVDPDRYLAVFCDNYGNILGWSRGAGRLFGLEPNDYSPALAPVPSLADLLGGVVPPAGFLGESASTGRLLHLHAASGEVLEAMAMCVPLEWHESGLAPPRLQRYLVRFTLREAARAQPALRTSEVFDSFMPHLVHDLRSPVSAIVSFAATLRMGLAGPLTADQRRQISIIETCAEQVLGFLGDLPELLRTELGLFDVMAGATTCRAVLTGLSDTGLREAERARVTASLPAPDIELTTDPALLGRILSKLISYLLRRSPEGMVTVDCELSPDVDPRAVRFVVVDPGPPMSAEEVELAFRPFSRVAGRENSAASSDLGLDLHQSRLMAASIGASISMQAKGGGKNIISIIIPGGERHG